MEKLQEMFRRPTARLAAVFIVILAAGLLLLWFAAGVPEFYLGQILAGAIAAIFAATDTMSCSGPAVMMSDRMISLISIPFSSCFLRAFPTSPILCRFPVPIPLPFS